MSEQWVGFGVSGDEVIVVGLLLNPAGPTFTVVEEATWKLQKGDEAPAYRVMFEKVVNYLVEKKFQHIVIKGSSANPKGMNLAHLKSAELRGVVIAAAAKAMADVKVIGKATVSKNIGKRNTDEYIQDDKFWTEKLEQSVLKKKSREVALFILMASKQ